NDPTNAGIDWALLCKGGASCGSLKPLHTTSGTATTYTPPQSISGNSATVTVEAFATANHDSNAVTSLTVTGFASSLKGNYVFATRGEDSNGTSYQVAGVIVLDGNGNVTAGEQTFSDAVFSVSDAITGGSYYIGPDGRGTITLNTADQNIGQQGIENLALVFLSSSEALVQTLDNPNLALFSNELSFGTLELQTSKAPPTGGYAFVADGFDVNLTSMAMGGILNIDSPNSISGNGSITDEDDAATGITENATVSGSLTSPDSFGSFKLNLTTGFAPSLQFTAYIVDSSHVKLVESDINGTGGGFGATSGIAIGQGIATGTFTGNSSFAGTYVFHVEGQDPSGLPISLASAGQFSADSNGNLNSGYDNEVLSAFGGAVSDSLTGTYTLSAGGIGRVDSFVNFSVSGAGPELIFYLTGNGNPILVLDADDNTNSIAVGSIGSGAALAQSVPPFSFNGKYGVELASVNSQSQDTATGQIVANASSSSITEGEIDTNVGFQLSFVPGQTNPTSLSGAFGAPAASGRFTGTLSNTYFPATTSGVISGAFYPVTSGLVYFIETDFVSSGQSTFGFLMSRTPVCPTCE
ncbi:MAG TPA: hypothetical protein VKV04_14920, partial [Verrucomicrobiae bacterium]|nr:hypothetical protein [Verrucomicrobiae bacterium]